VKGKLINALACQKSTSVNGKHLHLLWVSIQSTFPLCLPFLSPPP
jgi:hypothetical protein